MMSLTALGVVFGDIGTSPLYAMREAFADEHGIASSLDNVLGILSLILYSLVVIISVKYVTFVLRADNRGEGGVLSLTSLVTPIGTNRRGRWGLIALGLFGCALLYGDGIITPAVSVISAVEGVKILAPALDAWIVPITVVILAGLFMLQRRGTAGVGTLFGPVTLLWFIMIAALGIWQIFQAPEVLRALWPGHAIDFFMRNGVTGYLVLGSVVLVVTGGEALYADMGHFGAKPIRLTWFVIVLPSLLLNYFGQAALISRDPLAIEQPFFLMAPQALLLPVVIISTCAAVIASQALISGTYSLTMQAVQLGYAPRVRIDHTSAEKFGQIFIPGINWALMLACIGLVVGFRSSENMTAAYGVAVTGTMTITTILLFFVAREKWKWSIGATAMVVGTFFIIDIAFLITTLYKVKDGGWFPLAVGVIVFALLTTWKRGRVVLTRRMKDRTLPRDLFVQSLGTSPPTRVPGTAVFMFRSPEATPPALLHNLKHNKVLHKEVVFLSVLTEDAPHVSPERRSEYESLGHGIHQLVLRYGFMEEADVPAALATLRIPGLQFKPMETTYFLGRETLITSKRPGMARWRSKLFTLMARNERAATSFFRLPPNRVVELGAQIEL